MRRAVLVSAVVMLVGCGKNGVNPVSPDSGNRAPVITSVQIDPAIVPLGGTATIHVVASDPDNDNLTVQYSVDHGVVTPNGSPAWTATYQEQGSSNDALHVTVTDTRLATARRDVVIPVASQQPPPTPTPEPTPAPTPEPTPGPTVAPTVAPANRPPTVSVSASASTCHPPTPTQACTVTCTASATDPDSDTLSYSWSGCASGSGSSATCTVSNLSAFTCSVKVSDGRGGTASGNATVTGVNHPPSVSYNSGPISDGTSSSAFCGTGANVYFDFVDADNEYALAADGVVVSGPCTLGGVSVHPWSTRGLWAGIMLPATPQQCQVAVRAADGWGYTSMVNSPVFTCQ